MTSTKFYRTAVVALAACAVLPMAGPAYLSDGDAAALVASYMNEQPAANPEGLSDAEASCSRAEFNKYSLQQTGAKVYG